MAPTFGPPVLRVFGRPGEGLLASLQGPHPRRVAVQGDAETLAAVVAAFPQAEVSSAVAGGEVADTDLVVVQDPARAARRWWGPWRG